MVEMNPLAKKWVEALLSGKYKQGTHCLRNADNEFCCLGVALDVIAPDEWSSETVDYDPYMDGENVLQAYRHEPSHKVALLPPDIWDKLTEGAPNAIGWSQGDIAEANDLGRSFREIVAHYIEPMWQTERKQNNA